MEGGQPLMPECLTELRIYGNSRRNEEGWKEPGRRINTIPKSFYTEKALNLSTFTSDTPRELNVLGHDSDSLGVNGAEVSVLKKTDQIGLGGLLEGGDGGALESEIGLEVLRDLTDQTLERKLPDQKLSALLRLEDFVVSSDGVTK
ncbi:hypothetical protein TIFTF001_012855 [Ficus carica]|uniref:Uncharacterized protein n=1 Tax=Ficus carica TaxID=3494 RepID=A0AA87ZZS1_FICCA|nr:hypothetical protein TIFTF001_012855 [Ficus carica]